MKKVIVILAFVAVSALLIGCGVEKAVDLDELQQRGDVYFVKKTQKTYSGKFITTYGNNAIKEAGILKNGRRDGKVEAYYENGKLMCVENYKNGKRDGKWEAYYENGKLMRVESYKNGKRDGEWERYDESGNQMLDYFRDKRDDGKIYATVKIGSQTWMAENLNYDVIDSKCYDGNPDNCTKYGRLYDWNTAKKVCPEGWHLPSKNEYEELDKYIGGKKVAGKKLKSKNGWSNNSNSTDEFGFSALPGGYGYSNDGFYDVGDRGYWWSNSTDEYNNNAYYRDMYYSLEYANWYNDSEDKHYLFSVRCVKDYGEAYR